MNIHKGTSTRAVLVTGVFSVVILSASALSIQQPAANAASPKKGAPLDAKYFDVEISGDLWWQELDGSTPLTRVGRLTGKADDQRIIINAVPHECATRGRINMSFLTGGVIDTTDLDVCLPLNVDWDLDGVADTRVYGGTMIIDDVNTDPRDNGTDDDVSLSIPDTFTTTGKDTWHSLTMSIVDIGVTGASQSEPFSIADKIRAMDGDTLTLTLFAWDLSSSKRNTCSGFGSFVSTTTITITNVRDTVCP